MSQTAKPSKPYIIDVFDKRLFEAKAEDSRYGQYGQVGTSDVQRRYRGGAHVGYTRAGYPYWTYPD